MRKLICVLSGFLAFAVSVSALAMSPADVNIKVVNDTNVGGASVTLNQLNNSSSTGAASFNADRTSKSIGPQGGNVSIHLSAQGGSSAGRGWITYQAPNGDYCQILFHAQGYLFGSWDVDVTTHSKDSSTITCEAINDHSNHNYNWTVKIYSA